MSFRNGLTCALGITLSGLLLAGCAAVPRQRVSGKSPAAPPDPESQIRAAAHYATGLSYELNDQPELALEEMLQAAEADPGSETVVLEAVQRCLRAQKPERAIALLKKAAALPGASAALDAWLGLSYAQAGDTDLAVAANRAAIAKMPDALAPYQNLAQLYLQNSRTNEALQTLDEAAAVPVDDPAFLIDLADLYLRFARVQGVPAVKGRINAVLDRAAAMTLESPVQVLRMADAYFLLDELEKAEPLYRRLTDEHSDWPEVRRRLAEIYLRGGQKEKAAEQLQALARSEPTNPQAYVFLGAIAVEEKNWTAAAENFERAIKLNPDLEPVYYDLAGLKLTLKKPEEARALLETARSRFKRSFPMEFYTGLACSALKDYREALKYLTSAEAIAKATEPARLNHAFYFQMGATYERAGQIEDAEKSFRQALKLAPDDAETLNYLGYMWAEKGVNLDEARRLIDQAVRLEPENAAFLDSQAWVLYRLNRPQEALPPMLKAIELTQEPDPTLYDHLGDIYAALGQLDNARDAWGKALTIEPNAQIEAKVKAPPSASRSP